MSCQAGDLREWSRRQLDKGAWAAEWAGGGGEQAQQLQEREEEDMAWSRAGPRGALQPSQLGGPSAGRLYDKVLLDAPCTGVCQVRTAKCGGRRTRSCVVKVKFGD